jgi:exopolysaccharide production protein ExoZ
MSFELCDLMLTAHARSVTRLTVVHGRDYLCNAFWPNALWSGTLKTRFTVAQMISRPPSPKLLGVQYLRAIAALMVAYLHLLIQIPEYAPFLDVRNLVDMRRLGAGVDIFFVISGFIMFVTSRNSSPGEFAVRRIIRIVPLYWLLTLVLTVVLALHPQFFRSTVLSGEYLLKSFLFIPYSNPGPGGDMAPILVPGWTLNFEMFFYAIFTLVLFFPEKTRLSLTGVVFAGVFAVGLIWPDPSGHTILAFYSNPKIFEFWAGILIGHLFVYRPVHLPRQLCVALVIVGFCLLLANYRGLPPLFAAYGDSVISSLVPATIIVFGMVGLETGGKVGFHRLLGLLGDSSYSIYLTHIFSLGVARLLWSRLHMLQVDMTHAAMFAVFGMVLTLVNGVIVYRLLEKPMLNVLQSAYRRARMRTAAVPI